MLRIIVIYEKYSRLNSHIMYRNIFILVLTKQLYLQFSESNSKVNDRVKRILSTSSTKDLFKKNLKQMKISDVRNLEFRSNIPKNTYKWFDLSSNIYEINKKIIIKERKWDEAKSYGLRKSTKWTKLSNTKDPLVLILREPKMKCLLKTSFYLKNIN